MFRNLFKRLAGYPIFVVGYLVLQATTILVLGLIYLIFDPIWDWEKLAQNPLLTYLPAVFCAVLQYAAITFASRFGRVPRIISLWPAAAITIWIGVFYYNLGLDGFERTERWFIETRIEELPGWYRFKGSTEFSFLYIWVSGVCAVVLAGVLMTFAPARWRNENTKNRDSGDHA